MRRDVRRMSNESNTRFAVVFRQSRNQPWKLAPYPWHDTHEKAERIIDWLVETPTFEDTELRVAQITILAPCIV